MLEHGGGLLFPFQHGYAALGVILDTLPKDSWQREETVLCALVLYLVKKGWAARAKSYLTAKVGFEKSYRHDLCRLLLAHHLGDGVTAEDLAAWRRLERALPVTDLLLHGLYHNCMLVVNLRLGQPDEARVSARHAISCFREARHRYLEHFIHLHLADLNLLEGRLRNARRNLAAAQSCLSHAAVRYANESGLIEIVRLAIAFEQGHFALVRPKTGALRAGLVSGDSWSELFCQLARISVLSAYFLDGPQAAHAELANFQADYARRHGGRAAAIELLGALIAHLEWQPEEVERILMAVGDAPVHSSIGGTLWAQLQAALVDAIPAGPRDETPRSRIIFALQCAQAARGAERRRAIETGLRIAADEGQVAPFLEHRDTFLGVSARLAGGGFAQGRRTLARFATIVLRAVEQSYVIPPPLSRMGFNRRQYRVAAAIQSGATNKQVGRQLGISEAAVKYHLTALFRKSGTSKRSQFIEIMNEIRIFSNI